ncbi:hypothetical protein FDP41_006848 [Naegleria fowleri]|uniref:F-box domain-containing protein n=1 Tax=Naegleria fowleri TaxID=5763 RepID=A0A6A5BJH8_NAEFO|nr:uncharacterized protein FDP41_006848 [Naegleria fowleri]KAF0974238.1 hypothetical protein FDP41_006848 [Naegleria fowleri]
MTQESFVNQSHRIRSIASSTSSSWISSSSSSLFHQIPPEVWTDQIFQFMGGSWIFSIGRLVCREWNTRIIHHDLLLQIKLHVSLKFHRFEEKSKYLLQKSVESFVKSCVRERMMGVKDLTFSGLCYLPFYENSQSINYYGSNCDHTSLKMIEVETENGKCIDIDPKK